MKRVLGICMAMCLMLVCLTGCMKMNMDVEIKADGTASVTSKMMLEEDAYETLLSFESSPNGDVSVSEDESELDLESFKKEVIDGETYYTFEQTIKAKSYEELEKLLMEESSKETGNLFSKVSVTKKSNIYSFKATTAATEDSGGAMSMGDGDWLSFALTVTMPGKIVETTGKKIDDNTVEFKLDDFSKAQTLSVESKAFAFGLREYLLCGLIVLIIGGVIAFLVYRRKQGYRF